MADLINPAPEVHARKQSRPQKGPGEALDAGDIFEFIRDIQDPEHPYSLEQLNVVQEDLIELDNNKRHCKYAHCSYGIDITCVRLVNSSTAAYRDRLVCMCSQERMAWNICNPHVAGAGLSSRLQLIIAA